MQIEWDFWKGALGVATAALALLTGLLAYRAARANREAAAAASADRERRKLRVVSVSAPPRRSLGRAMATVFPWLMIAVSVPMIALHAVLAIRTGETTFILLAALFLGMIALAVTLRWLILRKPDGTPSRTRAQSAVTIAGSRDNVLDACLDAIRHMQFEVTTYDAASGRFDCFFRSRMHTEHRVAITVATVAKGTHSVTIAVDAPLHTALFDFGMNRRLTRRFLRTLAST